MTTEKARCVNGLAAQASEAVSDPVAGKTVAEVLGEIVWLMTQDPVGREMKVAEIEALVMPAILSRRFQLKYTRVPEVRRQGATTMQPVSVTIFSGQTDEGIIEIAHFSLPTGRVS